MEKMSWLLIAGFVLSSVLFAGMPTCIGQVHVDTAGSDMTGSGTLSNPYRTISYGVQQASASATVYVHGGLYEETDEILIDKPLTLKNYDTGLVVIDADGRPASAMFKNIIRVINASDVLVSGVSMKNCIGRYATAVFVSGVGNNITVRDCSIENIGWVSNDLVTLPSTIAKSANAILVMGDSLGALTHVSLLSNVIHNCATGYGAAITITHNVDTFSVDSNRVYEISNTGIHVAGINSNDISMPFIKRARNGQIKHNEVSECMSGMAVSAGIYIDGAVDCILDGNKTWLNGVGMSIGAKEGNAIIISNIIIRNNVVYNNCIAGLILGDRDFAILFGGISVYNNTFYKNRTGTSINGVDSVGHISLGQLSDSSGGEIHFQNSYYCRFDNNIVYPSVGKRFFQGVPGSSMSFFSSDYNLFYRDDVATAVDFTSITLNGLTYTSVFQILGDYMVNVYKDFNSIESPPGFNNAGSYDFSPVPTAPGINMGSPFLSTSEYGMLDFAGNPRINNTQIDIGAYERQIPASIPSTSAKGAGIIIYPSPARDEINIAKADGQWREGDVIVVYDMQGRKMERVVTASAQTVRMNTSEWSSGVYFVVVQGVSGARAMEKVVVER
jgi:hypothetical protein